MAPLTRAQKKAVEAVCRPTRLSVACNSNFAGMMTRSVARALEIIKPESQKKQRRAAKVRARRQTTNNHHQPVRRTIRRIKSMYDQLEALYCICRGPDIGTLMVMCENAACQIQWYHVSCLKGNINFEQRWICPFCV